ncbi:COPII vesicle coat protein Sec16, putative [Talaromyces stipitatus ATCC 10500]|uniref:Protein transport protein sec16 n=1 Tax=Talaromyces stipitatus (strain ATCC 10500 / CBS 375.48 / QM 6759 / NRRL 1006) TaxID=441959 RepID=B8M6A5_TALSN|nr:COPII vesicle coat protein Sec16, putative [Talaromyces stipitatus ATCC 10500]EED19280.1 COPII vesicle coat protein Sec16, putative [Talaromyces stipitatus ATCC 10500]
MTETMSHLPENLIKPHLTGASWNPAMRPEDAPDASVPEANSLSAIERLSQQTDEIPADDTVKEDIISKSESQSTPGHNVATISTAEHNESPAPSIEPTEEEKPLNINWGEEADAIWNIQSQNPFEREDVAARTNSFPPVSNTTEPTDEEIPIEQHASAPQNHEEPHNSQQEDSHSGSHFEAIQNNNDNNFWEADGAEDDEGEFFDQLKTQTKPIYVPPEAESRFEEGIPLVENESNFQTDGANKDEPQLDDVFRDDEEDDFFASAVKGDNSAPEKPTVLRKSTYDVLGGRDSSIPDSPVGESPAAPELEKEDDDLAARWQAELDDAEYSPDVPEPKAEEEDLAARWQAELDDDDDDLLLENETKYKPREESTFFNGDSAGDLWSPQRAPSNYTNPYTPHQPSSTELFQSLPNIYTPVSGVSAPPSGVPETPTEKEAATHSFVDQAKDGYKSPYDLPESLAPRPRRAAARRTAPPPSAGIPPPPPRSSSIPPSLSIPVVSSVLPQPGAQKTVSQPVGGADPVANNFFEELPALAPRQHPGSRTGAYTPAPVVASAPPPGESMLPPSMPPPSLPLSQVGPDVAYQNQLQAPERMGPYANLTVPMASAGPGIGPRYSPKPPSTTSKSPLSSRYSPAPPSSQPPNGRNRYVSQPNNLPFQPRTSSPLAHHEKTAYEAQTQQRPSTSSGSSSLTYPISSNHTRGSFSVPTNDLHGGTGPQLPQPSPAPASFSPPANPCASSLTSEPSRRSSTESPYTPHVGVAPTNVLPPPANDLGFAPLRRSQTQSPGRQSIRPSFIRNPTEPVQRPASVHEPGSPTQAAHAYTIPQVTSIVREVPELDFIKPTDSRKLDPLQRWKGAPVFKFAFGGLVSSCFPQHIPRYTAGQMNPMIQPAPGETKVRQLKQILPDGDIVRYPGPLKTKSKKKDVVAWLSSRIAALENEGIPPSLDQGPDALKKHDEKILLWKLLRILVENDGALEGTSEIEKSIRNVISPELESTDQGNGYDTGAAPGLYHPTNGSISSESVASKVLGQIKTELLGGYREKAVWLAVDNRLWGHAMVISSTLDKALWKQVVQEFVRREVRSAGENIESLAALYAVISGNTEESIDELVPPSARLGLQMVSKEGQGINKNAVDGLERWRETLGLIINNRSPDDHQALVSLGQLLGSYGRTEASHVCYLFAKAFSQRPIFGGADDSQASIVLLGADHLKFPTTYFQDEDAIALTEVYEFATSVLAGSAVAVLPYLQPYKLQHAYILADKGLRTEAMHYCEAIGSVLKASTKPSPYYHQRLFAEIDELATRLKQAPGDGASSWISKPNMEKVSGSMWARFNSFVAGDENEAASNGSATDADVGPFAKVTEPATISRPPSVSEVYGSYSMVQPASNAFSRYAPANQFAPSSSPEQYRARSSMESQRSPSIGVTYNARRGSQEPATPVESSPYNFASSNAYGSPTSFPYHSTPPQSSYVPLAPVEEDLATQAQPSYPAAPQQSALTSGLQASPERFGQPLHEVNETSPSAEVPHYGGYEPPSISSYEPPSYHPDLGLSTDGPGQEEESDEPEEKPKKKTFMDDDDDEDDLAARAAAIQKAEKARRDREADEAVRRAAEADAQRPAAPKKGWFGSWWGGKKEGESSGGPIRAKLGEENSFYYDPELKKWVNKKDPNSATASTRATPPPPKGPSRSASVGSTPPPPPASALHRPPSLSQLGATLDSRPSTGTGVSPLVSSPAFGPPPPNGGGLPPRSVSTTAAATASTTTLPSPSASSAKGAAPLPRPSTTSLSNASSIDDLLGAPTARKGGTVKSKKKGRGYIDVMAK